jgi:hypothetical protein
MQEERQKGPDIADQPRDQLTNYKALTLIDPGQPPGRGFECKRFSANYAMEIRL